MRYPFYFVLLTLTLILPMNVQAQDNPMTAQDRLIDLVGKTIVEETTQRSEEVRKAKEILDIVLNSETATSEDKKDAEKSLEDAEDRYAKAQNALDTARVDAIAAECGKTSAEIQAMRNSGMGWGKIAKECGTHPSVVGKGKGKSKSKKNKGKGKDK